MGSPVSSVVANPFMENFENRAINSAGQLWPRMWRRNVDDVLSIVQRTYVQALLAHVNGMDGQIEFT